MEKIIHYCWFGHNPKSKTILQCINSWKKYAPDFKIIEWNENNFDVNICTYTKEAYNNKKWAFISDFCRFYVLEKYGGIYLDTDVELIKSIVDLPDAFIGWENSHAIASGLIRGANVHDFFCAKMLESYYSDIFDLNNLVTVCERETKLFASYGLKINGKFQTILNTVIYPKDYFCPLDVVTKRIKITKNTYSIHHYIGSWSDKKTSFKGKVYNAIYKILGEKIAYRLYSLKKRIFGKKK